MDSFLLRALAKTGRVGAGFMALALGGCGIEVAQTAVLEAEPSMPLDCSAPAAPPELPTDPHLGANMLLTEWPLVTGDYSVGQGPGVAVAALDAFRLFVNGHLVATGTEPLVPSFVPITLLPGMNGVAVVVTAAERAPALLAEVDELERAYGSDAHWKVSSTPDSGYGDASFDDSGWADATDRGPPDASPGCDPGPGFPSGSDAHLITATAPGTAVFRLDIPIVAEGFAAATTGGGTTTPVLAATVDDLVTALKGDDPKVVLMPEGSLDVTRTGSDVTDTSACPTACPDGSDTAQTENLLTSGQTCAVATVPAVRSERRIRVGSNTTLVGLSRGAALKGGSLDVAASTNVIIRNLAMYDVNPDLIEAGDGISIDGADGVWVDHATFRFISDGFIDCTTGSKNLTFSWIKNEGDNAAACFGKHPRSNELGETTATIHHTLWEHVDGRAPLATGSTSLLHLYDNVVLDDIDFAVGASCGARVLLEHTSFESVAFPTAKFSCSDGSVGLIHAQGGDNHYGTNVGPHQVDRLDASEPVDNAFTPEYGYTLEPVGTLRFLVPQWAGAGARWALPLTE